MGWLSALGGIAKLASKLFGFMLMRKAVQADVMKDQLDDIHLKNEVTKKINATSVANKRKRLSKYVKRK
jgi:hypothetical protein|tara:strand:+ start:135 stop:341 length:207 start_codon:yes stop_codon:yes gene_type:complete